METYCGCSTFRRKYNLRFGGGEIKQVTQFVVIILLSLVHVVTPQNHLNISLPLNKIWISFVGSNNSN